MDYQVLGILMGGLIGFVLGLFGGGGSILAVPVFVYILKMEPKVAIASSLVVVGAASLFGVIIHAKQKNIEFKIAFLFAASTMVAAFFGAKLSSVVSGTVQLVGFAILMNVVSIKMLLESNDQKETQLKKQKPFILWVIMGVAVGLITGFVGIGGGFLIVPALVFLGALPFKQAVGTSLVVVLCNAVSGALGYIGQVVFPVKTLVGFIFLATIGMYIGVWTTSYVSAKKLKKAFAVFLMMLSVYILIKK